MTYEQTPIKKTKLDKKQVLDYGLSRISTASIIWFLVKRHKVGLLGTWATVMTVLWALPGLPTFILSLFNK